MGQAADLLIEDASYTALGSDSVEEFFVTRILVRTLSGYSLPDLEFSFDNDVAKVVFAALFHRDGSFVHHHLRHLKQNILTPVL